VPDDLFVIHVEVAVGRGRVEGPVGPGAVEKGVLPGRGTIFWSL